VRQWRCRYRLGKTRAGSAFNLGIFAVRRSSRSCDIGSASMRLTASASRQGVAVDLMPADRPLLRRPTPTSHFFNRLKRRTKTEANSNSFSTTSAICSISTIRSYIRVWTLDYWRRSARPWIPERSATCLREADLNVLSKLGNQGLEGRLEPEAFTRREVGREDDLLDVLVGCPVDIQVARQPST
jgi:hypothetical protein